MRVLWISGLPRIVQQLALAGHDVGAHARSWIVAHLPPPDEMELHIACLWPGGDRIKTFRFEGATFHLCPCPPKGRSLFLFQRDKSYFKPIWDEVKPELVHGWGTEDSFGLVARKLEPEKHVIGLQGLIRATYRYSPLNFRTALVRFTESMTLRKARYVVGESNFSLRVVAPLCPGAHKRVIEHPVRREFLDSEPSDGGDSNLLFVGSILETKGIFDAIRAFAAAVPAPWQMHVVGSGPDQNQRRMFDLVQQIKIGSRFHHWPELEIGGLISLMKRSSVFLLPTRIDTGPTALKESLSMGLWPICYDNSGPAEYIRKHRFGSLAVDGDFDSLCGELSKCISARPWNANGDRNAVIQRARTTFSREAAWNDLIDLYAVIAAGGVGRQLNSAADRTAPELSEL